MVGYADEEEGDNSSYKAFDIAPRDGKVIIGKKAKDTDNDINIANDVLSRKHCVIDFNDNSIEDFSSNGTLIHPRTAL